MLPSGMDGLERAALTEKSQGDASRRPGRRSFSAPAGGQGGVGGGVSSWHLLTPSALTLWKFIVAVVVVVEAAALRSRCATPCLWMCCSISNGGRMPQNRGCGTHTSKRWDYVKKRKKRRRHGIVLWLQ